jgi:hypothetical protein
MDLITDFIRNFKCQPLEGHAQIWIHPTNPELLIGLSYNNTHPSRVLFQSNSNHGIINVVTQLRLNPSQLTQSQVYECIKLCPSTWVKNGWSAFGINPSHHEIEWSWLYDHNQLKPGSFNDFKSHCKQLPSELRRLILSKDMNEKTWWGLLKSGVGIVTEPKVEVAPKQKSQQKPPSPKLVSEKKLIFINQPE